MVLSENNEPNIQKGITTNTNETELEPQTVEPSTKFNPGKRLRAIEMAALRKSRDNLKARLSSYFSKNNLRPKKLFSAFINFCIIFSFLMNIILLGWVVNLNREKFELKRTLVGDVLGGIYLNIEALEQASIKTDLTVRKDIPVEFPLNIKQESEIILSEDTPVSGAIITISTGGLNIINAPADIILPAGTRLPVKLDLTVPVTTTLPVKFDVPVDILISDTELSGPITGIKEIIQPYLFSFMEEPMKWQEIPSCKFFGFLCAWWYK